MYDPNKHNRRSIRIKGKDYTEPGYYYATLCTHNRECLFGSIFRGHMIRNDFGEIAHTEWVRTEKIRDNIEINEFIVMPNHLHGIIRIKAHGCRGTEHRALHVGNQLKSLVSQPPILYQLLLDHTKQR